MKHLIKTITIIAFLMFTYGFVVPTLISYPSTTVALGGTLYAAVVVPAVIWFLVAGYFETVYNKLKGN